MCPTSRAASPPPNHAMKCSSSSGRLSSFISEAFARMDSRFHPPRRSAPLLTSKLRDIKFEAQQTSLIETLQWGLVSEALSRAGVDAMGDVVALTLREIRHADSSRQVLAN